MKNTLMMFAQHEDVYRRRVRILSVNAKCRDYKISVEGFKKVLEAVEHIERRIASKNDKALIHFERWSPILPL